MELDISLKVKPDLVWVDFVRATARSYLLAQSLPPNQIESAVAAVGEAAEQLIGLCIERGTAHPYEVGFAMQEQAVHILITYDAAIPLNPHKEAGYEVPDTEGDIADTALEGLWLHIIKHTMDRVFFRLNGNRATLAMVIYRRSERDARRLWVMGLRPKLRRDLSLELAASGRDSGAIIHDIRSQRVLRLSSSDAFIVERMDGHKTLFEIYLEHTSEKGPIPPAKIKRLYEMLETAGLLDGAATATETRCQRLNRWLTPTFSIPRPDAAVTRAHRHARLFMNPAGVTALLLIGLSGIVPLVEHSTRIRLIIPRLTDVLLDHPLLLAAGYAILLFHVAVHEFAHGVTCKHFGGQVKRLGVMWYMVTFIFFCDTTSAWSFPKKSQRIWVSLAGPLVSWAIFGIVAWLAGLSAHGNGPQFALWTALTLIFGFILLMNFNPLIRMDAYYMLVDWTSIPNLQKRAFAWLGSAILGISRTSRSKASSPREPTTKREERIFTIYGVLSAVFSLLFILFPFYRLSELWMAGRQFTVRGFFSFAVIVFILARLIFRSSALLYAARRQEYKIS